MKQERNGMDCLCSAAILSCIVFGLFGCIFFFSEIEDMKWSIHNILSIFIVFSILCSFLYYSKKTMAIGIPFMIIFISYIVGIFRKPLIESIRVIIYNMLFKLDRYYGLGWNIKETSLKIPFKTLEKGILVLILITIFLLSIDVAGFFYAKRIFLLSAFILIFSVCIGKFPQGIYVFLLLFGLLGLCSMSSKSRDFRKKWRVRKGAKIEIYCREQQEEKESILHGRQKAAVFTIGCFLAALLLGLLFQKQLGEDLMEFHKPIQNWANTVEYTVLHYDYNKLFRGIPVSGKSEEKGSSGRLSNFEIQYSGKEVMRLTVDTMPKKAMYLRGFIGKDYKGNYWSEVDGQAFSKTSTAWEIENIEEEGLEQGIGNLVYSMIYLKQKDKQYNTSKLKLDYIDAPGQYAYLPYFTKIGDTLLANGDGMINRKGNQNDGVEILYTKGFWRRSGNYYRKLQADFSSFADQQKWEKECMLERQYAKYVKQQYLNVPETVPTLQEVCKEFSEIDRKKERLDEKTATKFIKNYLKEQASYSMDLNRVPYGQDFIEYFLYKQQKGYCIHFATAAVLMYRMLGIPARFVEGYVVWPEDFAENGEGGYTASIPDSRAHAWAEIYYKDFGFMPVDMTPGSYEEMVGNGGTELSTQEDNRKKEKKEEDKEKEENNQKKKEEEEEQEKKKKEEEEKSKKEKQDMEDKNKEKAISENEKNGIKEEKETSIIGFFHHVLSSSKNGRAFIFIVLVIFSIFLTGLLFMTCRIFYYRRKYKRSEKQFLQGMEDKNRKEVIKISCRFYGYLKHSGIEQIWKRKCGQNISDREYEELIKQEFDFLKEKEYHKFREVVQKAIYCSPQAENIISEQEARECQEFVELIKKYILEKLPWHKKILIKGVIG